MSIDTEIKGRPASVRTSATWLRSTLRPNIVGAADAFGSARVAAGRCWEGSAGEAFTGRMKTGMTATDALESALNSAAQELDVWAKALESKNLARQADDLAKNADNLKGLSDLRGLKLGGAFAIAGIGYDIAVDHKPVDQAVVAGGLGFGASVAAGAATGALVGSIVPVGGTIVGAVAGTVVGAGVGIFTSGMVDSLYENGIDDVGQAFSDGTEAVKDTGEAIGHLAEGGASAVAHGASGAWHSVFG